MSPARSTPTLVTLPQKAEVLSGLGVDVLAVLSFTPERARQAPEDFAREVLGGRLKAAAVVVGTGFRFGRGRAGGLDLLQRLGPSLGFRVRGVAPVLHEGVPISSTRIREALARGGVEAARALLGRPFFADGVVVKGEGRGRLLGTPTANLDIANETLPARGVYAAWCRPLDADGRPRWKAVVNVGLRPTFGGGGGSGGRGAPLTVEAHLLEGGQDLYGRRLRLEFAGRLRDEQTFPGAQALAEQIRRDVDAARRLLDGA